MLVLIFGCSIVAACVQKQRPHPTGSAPGRTLPTKEAGRAATPMKVVERCPSASEIKRLRTGRPKPLRDGKMPATTAERVARTAAQLGRYEAKGQWADQVEKALGECDGK